MAQYFRRSEALIQIQSPKRLKLPTISSSSPSKKSNPSTRSTNSLPKTCFQNQITEDIFNKINGEYLDTVVAAYQSEIYSSPSSRNRKPSGISIQSEKFRQYFDKAKQSIAEARLNLEAEKVETQRSLSSLDAHFRVRGGLYGVQQKHKINKDGPLSEEDIKILNRKRMMRYKLEKLELCQQQLEKILIDSKRKVRKYDHRKLTLDVGL